MVAKGVTALCLFAVNHRYKEATPPQYLGGTEAVCRLGHEIALDMAISQFAARARHTVAVRITRRSPQFAAHAAFKSLAQGGYASARAPHLRIPALMGKE